MSSSTHVQGLVLQHTALCAFHYNAMDGQHLKHVASMGPKRVLTRLNRSMLMGLQSCLSAASALDFVGH